MDTPEKPKKPERKPEDGCATCECGCSPEHGEKAQYVNPLPDQTELVDELISKAAMEEVGTDARHENAAGKKLCGMCAFRNRAVSLGNIWRCLKGLECPWPEPENPCINYFHKIQKIKPPKRGELPRPIIPPGVRFIYFGRPGPGVMTVAYSIHEKSQTIEMGYSFCSPMDNWIKAKGQDIALRRLNQRAVVANYLYEPRRLVVQIAQAMMERRFKNLGDVLFTFPGDLKTTVPGWSRDLARRLKVRTWECLVPKVNWPITKKVEDEILSFVFRRRPTADHIMARMVQDILNLGGGL